MRTDYIIAHLPLTHSCHKAKADLWVPACFPLTFTVLARKCPIPLLCRAGKRRFGFGCKIEIAAVHGRDWSSGFDCINHQDC